MKKFTCPYCYSEHNLQTAKLKCSYTLKDKDTGNIKNCVGNVQKDADGYIPLKDREKCMRCTYAKKSVYCPEVKKEIPSDFLNGKSLSVALLGAKASGKSNYIGVLINEIKRKMTGSFNCSLSLTSSEESKEYYENEYYKPLFINGNVVRGTDTSVDVPPLIFPLRFMNKRDHIVNTAALTFYDTAGEHFDSTQDMLINNRYIPNSDGIILLLDPLQVPSIRRKLENKMDDLPAQNTDVVEVLSRIVENIRDVKNIRGKIKMPLALVFTKIDALEKFDILREDSCLRQESEHMSRGVFVYSDFENVNIEIRDLLENWLDEELVQQMKNFEKYAFFGLSALGGIPQGIKLAGNQIKPRRVLDPLLWILAENKYIRTVKK